MLVAGRGAQGVGGQGAPHRIIYSSESVAGVAAAIEAGIAIGVLNESALKPDLTILSQAEGLGKMPASKLVLEYGKSRDDTVCGAMADVVKRAFAVSGA